MAEMVVVYSVLLSFMLLVAVVMTVPYSQLTFVHLFSPLQ